VASAKFNFKLHGVPKTAAKLKSLPPKARAALFNALSDGAAKIRETARELVPVDTGFLQKSIRVHIRKTRNPGFSVVARAFYGAFIEFGTRRNRAQPFLRPAFFKHISAIRKEAEKAVAGSMK